MVCLVFFLLKFRCFMVLFFIMLVMLWMDDYINMVFRFRRLLFGCFLIVVKCLCNMLNVVWVLVVKFIFFVFFG